MEKDYENITLEEKKLLEEERKTMKNFNGGKVSKFSRVIMILFGVLLPIIAFGTNLVFIPFPFSFYSPELYFLLVLGFIGISITAIQGGEWSKGIALFTVHATFLALVYSSLFSLMFIPLIPISVMALIIMGLGFLGFSPFFSLWASIIAFRRSFSIASGFYKKTTLLYSCILIIIVLPLIYTGIRTAASYSEKLLVYKALHPADETERLKFFREIKNSPGAKKQLLKYYTMSNGTSYDSLADLILCLEKARDNFYYYNSFMFFENLFSQYAVDSYEITNLYYLLYGEKIEVAEKEALKKIRSSMWGTRDYYYDADSENPWASVFLKNCQYDGVINLDSRTVYQEITMDVGADWDKQEMVCEFKVPPGGVVTKLSLWINGEEQLGVITGKEKAETAYETIVSKQRDPAIITWLGGDRYQLKVFPVERELPRKVRFGVSSPLFPGEKGLTYIPVKFVSRNFKITEDTVTGSIVDIRSKEDYFIYSPQEAQRQSIISVTTKTGNYKLTSPSKDVIITPVGKDEKRASIKVSGFTSDGFELFIEKTNIEEKILAFEGKNFTYIQCVVNPVFKDKDREPVNVTYFLDSTYPMERDGVFEDAKESILNSISNLKKEDSFNIISANYEVKKLFSHPREVSEETIKEAKTFLEGLKAEGGIDLAPALEQNFFPESYEKQPVFLGIIHSAHPLLTDGYFMMQNLDRISLDESSPENVITGLIMIDYKDNEFLEDIVSKTSGELIKVKDEDNLKESFDKVENSALNTKSEKILCKLSDMSDTVLVPSEEQNITSLEPAFFYIRVPKDKKLSGTMTVTDGNKNILAHYDLAKDVKFISDDHIARLWAYNYIVEQNKKDLQNALSDEEFKETVKLGMDYYMVTPYTSLIVLETDEQYKQFDIDKNYEGELSAPSIPEPETVLMFIVMFVLAFIIYMKSGKKAVKTSEQ